MKTSSVEFISRSPNPLPMKSEHRRFSSGLHGNTAADNVRSEWLLCMQPKAKNSLRAQAHLSKSRTETVKTKLLDIRSRERERKGERERSGERAGHTDVEYPRCPEQPEQRCSMTCCVVVHKDKFITDSTTEKTNNGEVELHQCIVGPS
ncbi:hypothetical protein TNCV_2449431 [Trichonephila clavipes]|nr:hypothetical protein TNCV_2449431 [Trichonephila clavipes]